MTGMTEQDRQQVDLSTAEEVAKTISKLRGKDQEIVAAMLNAYADGFIAGQAFQNGKIAS